MLLLFLIHQQLGATDTDTREHIENIGEKLDVVDRPSETKVPKMSGALVIRLTTAAALLAVVQNTHAGVKETADLRLRAIIGAGVGNFHNRTALNLLWAEHANLNAYHILNF